MIQIDAGLVAIFVTILFALLGLAVAWGTLREKVKHNREDIDKFISENTTEHNRIFDKIEEVNNYLRNGKVRS